MFVCLLAHFDTPALNNIYQHDELVTISWTPASSVASHGHTMIDHRPLINSLSVAFYASPYLNAASVARKRRRISAATNAAFVL